MTGSSQLREFLNEYRDVFDEAAEDSDAAEVLSAIADDRDPPEDAVNRLLEEQ